MKKHTLLIVLIAFVVVNSYGASQEPILGSSPKAAETLGTAMGVLLSLQHIEAPLLKKFPNRKLEIQSTVRSLNSKYERAWKNILEDPDKSRCMRWE